MYACYYDLTSWVAVSGQIISENTRQISMFYQIVRHSTVKELIVLNMLGLFGELITCMDERDRER